ncbi:MAG: deoxyguanosinetriphosphate triphosphohydrolase [Alphaproteobacteria bacterium]
MFALAPYASLIANSRGRIHPESPAKAPDPYPRSPYQRDRDRILHSTAFRRLGHKTQVFVSPKGDHIRTRLTHSLEVAQIARTLARALQVDEDLTEAIALSHDLGHPPFGHAGEDQLSQEMKPYGGFDHNDHALKILTMLEQRYPEFDGLNLTLETLEGVIKHNGPLAQQDYPLPECLGNLAQQAELNLSNYPALEAQIAGIADDIAYNHHDMEDGLKTNMFDLDQLLAEVPHIAACYENLRSQYQFKAKAIIIDSLIRRLIGGVVQDVLVESHKRLQNLGDLEALTQFDITHAGTQMIGLSPECAAQQQKLKAFLHKNMYKNPKILEKTQHGQYIVKTLFRHFNANPDQLPQDWQDHVSLDVGCNLEKSAARKACDYVAGMTDRFAQDQFSMVEGKKRVD